MSLEVGQCVGQYKVLDQLGRGGMSETYRAVDTQSSQLVVLKVPFADSLGDIAIYERYERENLIGRRLQHPNIQHVLGTGTLDGRAPYTVFEYIDGTSFRNFLDENAPLLIERAVALSLQLAEALVYCHAAGIIHRDLKPENVLISSSGGLKLLDFGIALVAGAKRVTWGPLSQAVGTPDYMAPEQIRGERGDARTDIYALGALLFEMVAGRAPYRGDDALSVMWQHVGQEAPRLRDLVDVSAELEAIVAKSLRRRPDDRYQSMSGFAADLAHPERVDLDKFCWPDETLVSLALLRPAGSMPTFWQATRLLLIVFAALAVIGILAQFAHSGH